MSTTHEITIWCDADGCFEWHQGSAKFVRDEAWGRGWRRRKIMRKVSGGEMKLAMSDLCPRCARRYAPAKVRP